RSIQASSISRGVTSRGAILGRIRVAAARLVTRRQGRVDRHPFAARLVEPRLGDDLTGLADLRVLVGDLVPVGVGVDALGAVGVVDDRGVGDPVLVEVDVHLGGVLRAVDGDRKLLVAGHGRFAAASLIDVHSSPSPLVPAQSARSVSTPDVTHVRPVRFPVTTGFRHPGGPAPSSTSPRPARVPGPPWPISYRPRPASWTSPPRSFSTFRRPSAARSRWPRPVWS